MDKPGVPGPSGTRYTNPVSVGHKSKYWVHFRFLTDEKDEIKKDVVICNLCEMRLAYTRHINTLSNHLKHNHVKEMLLLENSAGSPNVYQELESNPPHERKAQKRSREASLNPTKHTTNVDGTGDGNLQLVADLALSMDDITIRRPLNLSDDSDNNTMNQLNIDGTPSDAVIEFIIMDLQLPESTEDHGFQRIVANLRPPCAIPSAKTLEEEIIPRIYETFRVSVKASLSCITSELALTFEEWISNNTGSYVTISAYYLKIEEAKLERKILTTILTQSDWKEKHWRNMIDILLREWDLNIEKVTAVVVSSSSTELIKALINHSLTVVPCLLHTLQVYGQACFDNPDVAQILTKCRSVIKTITSHQGIYAALQEQSSALKENAILVDDYPGVWISTYNMLEQMVLHRTLITSILENMEGMDQELNQEWIEITNDQWKIIDDLMSILKPLQDTIMTLNEEERIPQVSVLMPLLQRLVSSHLIVQESDSETAKSFKESLSDMLYKRYEDGNVTLFLQIATTLDPRFKSISYRHRQVTEEESIVSVPLKKMLTKIIQKQSEITINIMPPEEDMPPSTKRSKLLINDTECAATREMSAEAKAILELLLYQSEAMTANSSPLQWWLQTCAKCPNLTKLAKKYSCVPACCAPPIRLPQMRYYARRAALPHRLIDKLLFLHGNYTV
ncbi:zinc finger BED domain-containing protein 1-like [Ooceraea biroi]|nr:zinc finger BED domain-containing protein 1-like [Ooceraea biroi]